MERLNHQPRMTHKQLGFEHVAARLYVAACAWRAYLAIGGHPSHDGRDDGGLERRQSGVVRRALDVAASEYAADRRDDRDARRTVRVRTVALRGACVSVRTAVTAPDASTACIQPSVRETAELEVAELILRQARTSSNSATMRKSPRQGSAMHHVYLGFSTWRSGTCCAACSAASTAA